MILLRDCGKHVVEAMDVGLAVIARQRDAGDDDFGVRVLQGLDDGVEVGLHLFGTDSSQAVVAAEGDDDDGGMQADYLVDSVEAVFSGVTADAFIDDMVAIAVGI